jgi:tetratricopeptide (TPR) repeat protein
MGCGKAALAIGWYLAQRGELHPARPYFEEALELQQRAGDLPNETVTRNSLGWLLHQVEDYDAAVRHLEAGLRLARRLGNPVLEAQALDHLGDLHEALLDAGTAEAHRRAALTILADVGHPQAAELRRKLSRATSRDGLDGLLRRHRLRHGMSQEDLAARTGLSVRTVRHLESGRAGRPRPETVRLLVAALALDGDDRESFVAAATRH